MPLRRLVASLIVIAATICLVLMVPRVREHFEQQRLIRVFSQLPRHQGRKHSTLATSAPNVSYTFHGHAEGAILDVGNLRLVATVFAETPNASGGSLMTCGSGGSSASARFSNGIDFNYVYEPPLGVGAFVGIEFTLEQSVLTVANRTFDVWGPPKLVVLSPHGSIRFVTALPVDPGA